MTDVLPPDWNNDFDLFNATYLDHPERIWSAMRDGCPVATTTRRGGGVLPVRYADIAAVARDTETFSSRALEATGRVPRPGNELKIPPVTSDPPVHAVERRVLLPLFNRDAIARLESGTRARSAALADGFAGRRSVDAADEYAQHIPVGVIVEMLGTPVEDLDRFSGWVAQLLKIGPTDQQARERAIATITAYFEPFVRGDREVRSDGLIAEVLRQREAAQLTHEQVLGMCFLLLIAGIDTTWSAIGASLWHLATHPEDRKRLIADPALMPAAVEELIRAYAPITIARVARTDTTIGGCPVRAGERVLLPWPAANRDPERFDDPDSVIIDRQRNPHVAFGLGIHRCLGSGLARMEVKVALEEWLSRYPDFELDPTIPVEWTGGNVRGPRSLHLLMSTSAEGADT